LKLFYLFISLLKFCKNFNWNKFFNIWLQITLWKNYTKKLRKISNHLKVIIIINIYIYCKNCSRFDKGSRLFTLHFAFIDFIVEKQFNNIWKKSWNDRNQDLYYNPHVTENNQTHSRGSWFMWCGNKNFKLQYCNLSHMSLKLFKVFIQWIILERVDFLPPERIKHMLWNILIASFQNSICWNIGLIADRRTFPFGDFKVYSFTELKHFTSHKELGNPDLERCSQNK